MERILLLPTGKNFSTTHYFKNDTEKVVNQRVDDEGDGYNYRLQLVYVEPLPTVIFFSFVTAINTG